jgi:hypothetical protein
MWKKLDPYEPQKMGLPPLDLATNRFGAPPQSKLRGEHAVYKCSLLGTSQAREEIAILLDHSSVQGVGHRMLLAIGLSGHNKPRTT